MRDIFQEARHLQGSLAQSPFDLVYSNWDLAHDCSGALFPEGPPASLVIYGVSVSAVNIFAAGSIPFASVCGIDEALLTCWILHWRLALPQSQPRTPLAELLEGGGISGAVSGSRRCTLPPFTSHHVPAGALVIPLPFGDNGLTRAGAGPAAGAAACAEGG